MPFCLILAIGEVASGAVFHGPSVLQGCDANPQRDAFVACMKLVKSQAAHGMIAHTSCLTQRGLFAELNRVPRATLEMFNICQFDVYFWCICVKYARF